MLPGNKKLVIKFQIYLFHSFLFLLILTDVKYRPDISFDKAQKAKHFFDKDIPIC